MMKILALAVAVGLLSAGPALGQSLQPGDRLAICGDSITQQHQYSADIEAYLACCRPVPGVATEQFGWGGETAAGFLKRMDRFMLPFGNNVATTCYGMNDGLYCPLIPSVADGYRKSQTAVVTALKRAGYRLIVLGSPGVVDPAAFARDRPGAAAVYNQTLGALADVDREVAAQQGVAFADVHAVLTDVMARAKAQLGDAYAVAGQFDGIHPDANGHLVMAYAFLKALGVRGDIGTITYDGATRTATATEGHTVLSCVDGTAQIQSDRYPFCFTGDPAKPDATAGIIRFFPFNDDLNRFRLVAKNMGADRVRVTFGATTREYAGADLAKGINLAADFLDNPFSKPFADELRVIQAKQNVESAVDQGFYTPLPALAAKLPEARLAYAATEGPIRDCLAAQAKAVVDGVPPVRYAIKVEAVK